MVLGCRLVSQQHKPAPKSQLATPSAFGSLVFDPETTARVSPVGWEQIARFLDEKWSGLAGAFDPSAERGLAHPERRERRPQGRLLTVRRRVRFKLVRARVDDRSHPARGRSAFGNVYACVPIPCSWALALCQSALEECCRRAQERVGLGRGLLAERRSAPALHGDAAVAGPCMDNANVVAGTLAVELRAALVFHDEVDACRSFEAAGKEFDFHRRVMRLQRRRFWRL